MEIINLSDKERAIKSQNDIALMRFCPLIPGYCNKKCVSYLPARYIEITEDIGRIAFGCCDSPMLIRRK